MGTKLDLSRYPYHDDFDKTKRFHRVMNRAGTPVQNRELIQSQTILQDQIEKFGRHIFTDGSVVEKCEVKPQYYEYIKIRDTYANGSTFNIENFIGNYIEANNGMKAHIVNVSSGSIAAAPDLNTLYINYLTAANNGTQKTFIPDSVLTLKTASNTTIGTITVANTASSGNSDFGGWSYHLKVSDGTIFSQGFFVDVEPQSCVVSKYNNRPDGVSVGFGLVEDIVTPEQDSSLYDNAAGSENYAAPGAHRLRLTPTLVVQNTATANASNSFFSLVSFVEGNPTMINTDPAYNVLGKELARRTDEESGNYVIEPFNMRTLTRYDANGTIDTTNVRLELDPGLAYIHGYRIKTVGTLVNRLRKGTDVRSLASQVVTMTMGNFVYCTEFTGHWDFTSGATVSLRSATANAISTAASIGNSIDAVSAPGSEIGTAKLLAVQYDSGVAATPSGLFRVYLFDIQMNSGQNFQSVKSLYTTTSGKRGFGDLVLNSDSQAVLNDSSFKRLIYPLSSTSASAIKNLKSSSNTTVTQFDFRTSSTIAFANTGVGTLTVPSSGVGGVNQFTYGIGTLDSISEGDFIIVANSQINTANLSGRVTVTGSNVAYHIGQVSNFVTANLVVGDLVTVGNTTDAQTRRILTVNSSLVTVANAFTNSYSNSAYWQTYAQGQIIPVNSDTNETIAISGSPANTATISLNKTFTGPFYADIYYNVRRVTAKPANKNILTSVFVKIDCTSNTTGPFSLGLPDVITVKNIWKGTTYANTNTEVKKSFTLDLGQTDMYYGLASITPTAITLTGSDKLLVELAVFKADVSSGVGFYSIESYPVDDTGLTSNTILTQFLPVYRSRSDGTVFPARSSIDFRLMATNTAVYATTIGAATVNPANTISLNTSAAYTPALDSSFEADIQYYLGRQDRIGMDTKGSVVILEGTPSESPVPAPSVQGGIDLALATIPPYPSLTMDDVRVSGSYNSVINFTYMKNRRYTMHDIGSIDQRLQVVEYYSVLNELEQSTKNLLIPSTTDLNRFKNGIFVDPFSDHSRGDMTNPQYNIAIDADVTEARPVFTQEMIELKFANSVANGVVVSTNGRLVLLKNERVTNPYLFQYFATQLRNPSQDVAYRWAGTAVLTPEGDYRPDVTINPDVVVNLKSFVNYTYNQAQVNNSPQLGWSTQWGTWRETSSRTTSNTTGGYPPSGQLIGTTALTIDQYYARTGIYDANAISITESSYIFGGGTTTTSSSSTRERDGYASATVTDKQSYNLGAYVTDVSLQPFIRPQTIIWEAHGLKPNQRHWTFFDDYPISSKCRQLVPNSDTVAALGDPMIADENGSLTGTFSIPQGLFRTGERKFRVLDIADLVTQNTILLSAASATFFGTNLTYAKNNIKINTTDTQNYFADVKDVQTVSSSQTTVNPTNIIKTYSVVDAPPNCDCDCACDCACACGEGGGGGDPAAQSWKMPDELFQNQSIGGMYISALDLYFERKDATLGVTVQIREMENGFPTTRVVPFGSKHLTSAEVTTSTDASLATTVTFGAPLLLSTATEYAVIVIPDGYNPNYALWTATLGGDPDVLTGSIAFNNSFVGNFFTSSADSGWTPYQQEDMKIAVYRLTFTELDSVATFVNEDYEFIQYNSYLGEMEIGEPAYFSNGELYTSNVSVTSGNTTVIVSTNAAAQNTATFSANSKIYIASNTNASAFIANVTSVVNTTALVINAIPSFTDTDCSIGHLKNNGLHYGKVHQITGAANTLVIANVNTDGTYYVVANSKIIGAYSNATVNVQAIVDQPYNTVMPKLAVSVLPPTALTFTMKGVANTTGSYAADANELPLNFATEQSFYDRERVVMSKTNEVLNNGGEKSLKFYARFQSLTEKASPAIDMIKCGLLTVYNKINNEDANNSIYESEKGNSGTAIDKYISKPIILDDGQDAEDLKVYVGAYLPSGTSMYVYARFLNVADPDSFNDKAWTPLSTNNVFVSSKTNLQDFVEYVYSVPSANTDPGDQSAWLNTTSNNIISYTSNSGVIYDTYKAFAIKVVIMSEGSHLVPRLQDVRALALQI